MLSEPYIKLYVGYFCLPTEGTTLYKHEIFRKYSLLLLLTLSLYRYKFTTFLFWNKNISWYSKFQSFNVDSIGALKVVWYSTHLYVFTLLICPVFQRCHGGLLGTISYFFHGICCTLCFIFLCYLSTRDSTKKMSMFYTHLMWTVLCVDGALGYVILCWLRKENVTVLSHVNGFLCWLR